MKRLMIAALVASSLTFAAAPAMAGPWISIDQRQANLDTRIDQGVRNGSLTRDEAAKLRSAFREIANLETQYRRSEGGLSNWERQELDRRMDALSARIQVERHDAQQQGGTAWISIDQRQAHLDARIDQGVRNGALTRDEAAKLRSDFRAIANLEAHYRRSEGGLSNWERQDLDRQMDRLAARIKVERQDAQQRGKPAWVSIDQRQAHLDARIDQNIRNGALTRDEAARLRGDFREIVNLETHYRRSDGGLNDWERQELNRRMNTLSARIQTESHDAQKRDGWVSIDQRQAKLDASIDQGVRSGALTRLEAESLRTEFREIARLERRYRDSGGGLSNWERDDLDQRMDALTIRIVRNKHDRDHR